MAWDAVWRRLPSRESVAAASAGLIAFLLSGLLSAAMCWWLLLWYASTLPKFTEAHEGFGDAMLLTLYAEIGFAFSMMIGMVCGIVVAAVVNNRLLREK